MSQQKNNQALIVFSNPKKESLSHALADLCAEKLSSMGFDCIIRNLYNPVFSPVIQENELHGNKHEDVLHEQDIINKSSIIVLISPVWWFSLTSVMKGWYERVLSNGYAFSYDSNYKVCGKLSNKKVLLLATAAGKHDSTVEISIEKSFGSGVWVDYCNVNCFKSKVFFNINNIIIKDMFNEIENMIEDLTQCKLE